MRRWPRCCGPWPTPLAPPSGIGGGIPFGGSGLARRARPVRRPRLAAGGLAALPALAGPRRDRAPHTMLASHVDRRADAVAAGAGGVAATAALSKQGTPYVWGAKGPDRFDCSGLTQWAWAQAGVRLGPDTYTQVDQGVPVAPGDVRAGDLIFPRDSFDGRGPGHVQLAISPTQVVHAPQTGDVVRIAPMPGGLRSPTPGRIRAAIPRRWPRASRAVRRISARSCARAAVRLDSTAGKDALWTPLCTTGQQCARTAEPGTAAVRRRSARRPAGVRRAARPGGRPRPRLVLTRG